MDSWRVSPSGLETDTGSDNSGSGFVWAVVMAPDNSSIEQLGKRFRLPEDVVADLKGRTTVPKVAAYAGGVEIVVHDLDDEGHLLELDLCIGPDHVISVHGPLTDGVDRSLALAPTAAARASLEDGATKVSEPIQLAVAIVGRICDSLENLVRKAAANAGDLDRRLRARETGDPEAFLDELFKVRHDLVTIGNRAAQSREACLSAAHLLEQRAPREAHAFVELGDRFTHVRTLCDGEKEFQQGLLDYYEHRTATKMNIAMERLALIAALALPVTAVASIYGMNVIVNYETDFIHLFVVLAIMVGVMGGMFVWAKKHGWW